MYTRRTRKEWAALAVMAVAAVLVCGCSENGAGEALWEKKMGRQEGGNIAAYNISSSCGDRACDTVRIGNQVWMAENLNYRTSGSWCYDNKPDNCAKYGRLYTWEAAVGGIAGSDRSPSGVRGVCPTGWHLPSAAEWNTLKSKVGSLAATKLKAEKGWNGSGGGTNTYGFSALPGGYRLAVGSFGDAYNYGYWWTATEYSDDYAYGLDMYNGSIVNEIYGYKKFAYSVRCVAD